MCIVLLHIHISCCIGQLKDLVGSHELGLSIQQETPQLLMEGDTLDEQDINCDSIFHEAAAMFPYEQDIMNMLIPTEDATHDIDQLPMTVDNKSIGLPVAVSSQSTESINTAMDSAMSSNICTSTSGSVTASTPVACVNSPSLNSLLAHVSSPLVTMNSSTASTSYPPLSASTTLTSLAGAPYSPITSSPLSLNGFDTNEVSSIVLLSSSIPSPSTSSCNTVNVSLHNLGEFHYFYLF